MADEKQAPRFAPHLTVVADIFATDTERRDIEQKIEVLADKNGAFPLALTGYGYKDETYRCLYLLADAPQLRELYTTATDLFPQVKGEHFQAMPHLSVLYGDFSEADKRALIEEHPIQPLDVAVDSLDLYLTNDPVDSWRLIRSFPLITQ